MLDHIKKKDSPGVPALKKRTATYIYQSFRDSTRKENSLFNFVS